MPPTRVAVHPLSSVHWSALAGAGGESTWPAIPGGAAGLERAAGFERAAGASGDLLTRKCVTSSRRQPGARETSSAVAMQASTMLTTNARRMYDLEPASLPR